MPAQEQVFNTKAVVNDINHTVQDTKFSLCKQYVETVANITNGCTKLAGIEYTERHNNVASIIYRDICAEYDLEHSKDGSHPD